MKPTQMATPISPSAPYLSAMLPPAYLAKKLTRPLPTKDGVTLRTIADARKFILAVPTEGAERKSERLVEYCKRGVP